MTTAPATPHFPSIASYTDQQLEDWGRLAPPLATPLEGELATRGSSLWKSADEKIKTGTWQCSPGKSRWEFSAGGEFIQVLAGEMTVTRDGQAPITLREGDTAVFPPGWAGTWEITRTLRKVYTIWTT